MSAASPRIHQHWSLVDALYRLTDAACIAAALALAARVTTPPPRDALLLAGSVTIILYYLAGEITGQYRNWRGASTEREVLCSLATWGYAVPVLLALGFVSGLTEGFARSTPLAACATAPLLVAACRVAMRVVQYAFRAKGAGTRRFAVVGINSLAFQLARNIEHSPQMGLRLAGFYDDRPASRLPKLPEGAGKHLGTIDQLVAEARAGKVHMVYVTFPMRAE